MPPVGKPKPAGNCHVFPLSVEYRGPPVVQMMSPLAQLTEIQMQLPPGSTRDQLPPESVVRKTPPPAPLADVNSVLPGFWRSSTGATQAPLPVMPVLIATYPPMPDVEFLRWSPNWISANTV